MIRLVIFIIISFLAGCSRLTYITTQAPEQIRLMIGGTNNNELLQRDDVAKENKEKIIFIEKLKVFFEKELGVKTDGIYEKTIFLGRDAVSYLGVRSKVNRIESLKECFPIVGCFPYLGFFSKEDAENYLKKQDQSISTYLRPVYAYSSLGKYNDRVLSSFFRYSEEKLAELIFHELFHGVFFIKDKVRLNENLATFFAKKMVEKLYDRPLSKVSGKYKVKRELLVELIKELNIDPSFRMVKNRDESNHLIYKKIEEKNKKFKKICKERGLNDKKCQIKASAWNSARLSEYKTYRSQQNIFQSIYDRGFNSLKEFFHYLKKQYKVYEENKTKKSFVDFLNKS